MSVPKSKRKESGFQVVDTATSIYNRILDICLRMPLQYTELILKPILTLAGNVADFTKKGNSVMPNKEKPYKGDVRIRRNYFQQAYSNLQALITRMNFFVDRPHVLRHKIDGIEVGVTEHELNSLAKDILTERELIRGVLSKDQQRYGI